MLFEPLAKLRAIWGGVRPPKLALCPARSNCRDFDDQHDRIDAGAASDSVFPSHVGCASPLRRSGSAAAVAVKQTGRTRGIYSWLPRI